jgi:CRP-like cAMP-binding protein
VPAACASDLASVPLFQSLSAADRAEVAGWFEVRDVRPGIRLVGEGTTGMAFFVICEGEVAVTSGPDTIGRLGPGGFFGEMALLGSGRRAATVTTVAQTRVLVIFAPEFLRLQASYPDVAAQLQAAMEGRLMQ